MAERPADSHVLIVGASSGVGEALARRLAPHHTVSALARRSERLAPLRELGVETAVCDVAELDTIEPRLAALVEAHGKLSHLVYCAGLQRIRPLRSSNAERVREMMTVNLLAPMEFARLFASQRSSVESAVFCAVGSIAARRAEPGIVPYAVAKAGLEALVRGLAVECAPRRAVGVAPGWLDTEMTQSHPKVYTPEFREALEARTPLGIASVESVVDVIEFLLGPAARHVTGRVLTVDGGASL